MCRCNLPPALLAEWPGSFTCHCRNMGVARTPNKTQHTKLTPEKKILPLLLLGFELITFWSEVWCSNQPRMHSIPYVCVCVCICHTAELDCKNTLSLTHAPREKSCPTMFWFITLQDKTARDRREMKANLEETPSREALQTRLVGIENNSNNHLTVIFPSIYQLVC